jgi:hypothetical protein
VRDYVIHNAKKIKRKYKDLDVINILFFNRQGIEVLELLLKNKSVFKKMEVKEVYKIAMKKEGLDKLTLMLPGPTTLSGSNSSIFKRKEDGQSKTIGNKRNRKIGDVLQKVNRMKM